MARKANNKKRLRQEQRRVRAMRHIRDFYVAQVQRLQEEVEGRDEMMWILGAVLIAAAKGQELEIGREEIKAQLENAKRDDVILYDETTGDFTIRPPIEE